MVGFLEIFNVVFFKEGDFKKIVCKDESDNKKCFVNMFNEDGVEWLNVNILGDWLYEK